MNKKDFEKKAVRHGECLLIPLDGIPEEAREISSDYRCIVSSSEYGHHHVALSDAPIKVFEWSGRRFLQLTQDGEICHLKSYERHETKPLFKGFFEIRIKRAYDYFAKKMREVQD